MRLIKSIKEFSKFHFYGHNDTSYDYDSSNSRVSRFLIRLSLVLSVVILFSHEEGIIYLILLPISFLVFNISIDLYNFIKYKKHTRTTPEKRHRKFRKI